MDDIEQLLRRALEVPTDSVDGDLALFAEIRDTASADDVPLLLDTMTSDQANFWTQEMLAEPACRLGGPDALPLLLEAFRMNIEERHDNDSFAVHLTDMVEEQPAESAEVLNAIVEQGDEQLTSRYPAIPGDDFLGFASLSCHSWHVCCVHVLNGSGHDS